jgi:hypothetical protein
MNIKKSSRRIVVGSQTFLLLYFVISILAASAGIFFAYIKELRWGLLAIGVAVLCFAILYFYKQFLQEKELTLANPDIWVDEDEMSVWIFKDKRVVKHQYVFRALHEVDRYRFKFLWSGLGTAKVICDSSPDDILSRIPGPRSLTWNWQKYILRFNQPLKKGQTKEIVLTYELMDENNRAFPYQTVSYAHVAGCSKLEMRFVFSAPLLPETVYLTKYNQNWDILERRIVPLAFENLETGIREYTIEDKPARGVRYHVEWQLASHERRHPDEATASEEGVFHVVEPSSPRLTTDLSQIESALKEARLSVKLVRGGGMLVGIATPVVLAITNHDVKTMERVSIELLPSADYNIESENPVYVTSLQPGSSKQVSFTIRASEPLEFPVNVKVDGKMLSPAIRLIAIRDNPYIYGNAIDNPGMFFGRQRELDDVFQAVTKPNKQDILLLGERRSGKTSLLYQLRRRIQLPYVPVYIVLNEIPAANVIGMVNHLVHQTIRSLVEHEILAAATWSRYRCEDESLRDHLKIALDAAREKLPDVKVVLLADEGDYLLELDDQLQNLLRAALQSWEVGADLRVVVAGTSRLSNYISKQSSPFYNHFRFVALNPLSHLETQELITAPAKRLDYSYESQAVEVIRQACGGHPYYCQHICYEAFALAVKRHLPGIDKAIAAEAVQKVTASLDARNSFKASFWEAANPEERAFMQQLAKGKLEGAISRAVADRLIDWQVVRKQEETFEFTALLFREWVKHLAGGDRAK